MLANLLYPKLWKKKNLYIRKMSLLGHKTINYILPGKLRYLIGMLFNLSSWKNLFSSSNLSSNTWLTDQLVNQYAGMKIYAEETLRVFYLPILLMVIYLAPVSKKIFTTAISFINRLSTSFYLISIYIHNLAALSVWINTIFIWISRFVMLSKITSVFYNFFHFTHRITILLSSHSVYWKLKCDNIINSYVHCFKVILMDSWLLQSSKVDAIKRLQSILNIMLEGISLRVIIRFFRKSLKILLVQIDSYSYLLKSTNQGYVWLGLIRQWVSSE